MKPLSLPIVSAALAQPTANSHSTFPLGSRGKFIQQKDGPAANSNVVCFQYWELAPAWGCPFRCAYCCLQTLPEVRFNKQARTGLVYDNWQDMVAEVKRWLMSPVPRMLIVGDLQDGLAFDSAYAAATGKPLTHHLVPLFAAQDRHRLIFLTKSTLVKHALKLEPTPQVIFSWSVNSDHVGRRWEQGAPLPSRRLDAATRMQEAGWPIRFRLDPMVPYQADEEDWRQGYAAVIDRINALSPEMVTVGALRASSMGLATAAEKNDRPVDLFGYLSEKDPSGFKYRLPFEQQVEMYRFAIGLLDRGRITAALCKEDVAVWKAGGLEFIGWHCVLDGRDVPGGIVSQAWLQTN